MLEIIEITKDYHCEIYKTIMLNLTRFNINISNYTVVNDTRYTEKALRNSFDNSNLIIVLSQCIQLSKEIITNFLIAELVRYDDFLISNNSKFQGKLIDLEPKNIYNSQNNICGYLFNLPKKTLYVISNNIEDINFIFENCISKTAINNEECTSQIIEEIISPKEIIDILSRKNLTLSIAESCTGGLIFHELTNVPGSSKVLKGGIVAYSNEAKIKLLNIAENLLNTSGAVSAETAEAMCKNISKIMNTNIGLATTGILGPDNIEKKPVGLVYIAVGDPQKILLKEYNLNGSRLQNKLQITKYALALLYEYLLTYK